MPRPLIFFEVRRISHLSSRHYLYNAKTSSSSPLVISSASVQMLIMARPEVFGPQIVDYMLKEWLYCTLGKAWTCMELCKSNLLVLNILVQFSGLHERFGVKDKVFNFVPIPSPIPPSKI